MHPLRPNDLEVLRILWEHGALKAHDIEKQLPYKVKNSALRWQLGELVERGHLTRGKVGKAYYYQARTTRNRALRSVSNRLARVFSRGSSLGLLGDLIETEDLSDEDLRELSRLAERKQSEKVSEKGSGKK